MPKPFLHQIVRNQGLLGLKPSRATSLLIYLASRQGSKNSTWVSRETICKDLGWELRRFDRYSEAINELLSGGYIVQETRPVANTSSNTLVVHFDCRPTLEKLKGLQVAQVEEEET